MTKAQLEAWLEGWREVEAFQDREPVPDPSTCLVQILPLCDMLRSGLKPGTREPADEEVVRDAWAHLRSILAHG